MWNPWISGKNINIPLLTTIVTFSPGGSSEKFWVGVCCWDSEALNLPQTTFS